MGSSYSIHSEPSTRRSMGAQVRIAAAVTVIGGFPKLGVPSWGPHNEDYSILGSRLGSPYFGWEEQFSGYGYPPLNPSP